MSTSDILLKLRIGGQRQVQAGLERTSASVKGLGRHVASLGKGAAFGGIAAGVTGLAAGFRFAYQEATESVKATAQTNAAIKSTGGVAGITAKHVSDLAGVLSNKTAIDDEAIQSSANLLLSFTKVRNEAGKGGDVFDRATAAALDLSSRGFGSIEGTSKQLGKALQDPIKGMGALGKAGVSFSEGQKKAIKAMVESGDLLGAQKMLMKEVETQVKGSAAASATPMMKLKVAFANLAETVGLKLIPYIDKGAAILSRFITQMQTGTGAGGRFVDRLKAVADAIQTFVLQMRTGTGAGGDLAAVLRRIWIIGKRVVGFLTDHPRVVAIAAAAWATYKTAAFAAMLATKAMAIAGVFRGGNPAATRSGASAGRAYASALRAATLAGTVGLGVIIASRINSGFTDALEGIGLKRPPSGATANGNSTVPGQGSQDLQHTITNALEGLFRADGGPIRRSGGYVVGERGPEFVQLPGGANVIPNHKAFPAGGRALGGGARVIRETDVVVQLHDREIARATVRHLSTEAAFS